MNWNQETEHLTELLLELAVRLEVPLERAEATQAIQATAAPALGETDVSTDQAAIELDRLVRAGRRLGLNLVRCELSLSDVNTLIHEGFPVGVKSDGDNWLLLQRVSIGKIDLVSCGKEHRIKPVKFSELSKLWKGQDTRVCLLAQSSLSGTLSSTAASLSQHHAHGGSHAHGSGAHGTHHPKPLKRLTNLLRLESRDIWTVVLFAFVSGVLGLATPLAVESLVNTVAWGNYVQPLFILSILLFGFLAFAGLLKLLQVIVAEILQRRIFVRIIGDLANRFPLAQRSAIADEHPPELANRYFDIMTIQKSVASLILDGISIVLQAAIGLVLLAFYHPYLLGFDIVLLFLMTFVTYILGRGAVKTAIEESRIKYRIGHWMQDIISFPTAFRLHGGTDYAIDHTNRLTVEYLADRRLHFVVLSRQYAFALILLAVASTALLGVGGWLVIRGELTLGQLVASELVVTAIVSAFAKIGKSLETYYDLLAAMDKVGHMLDVPSDNRGLDIATEESSTRMRWQGLDVSFHGVSPDEIISVQAGEHIGVTGPGGSGKSRFLQQLVGLEEVRQGFAEIAGIEVADAAQAAGGKLAAYVRQPEIFNGSVFENVRLGRSWLNFANVRKALERVDLWSVILGLPNGIESRLQTGGSPLSTSQCIRLMFARALISNPQVLLIDGALDMISPEERAALWHEITSDPNRVVIVVTYDPNILKKCSRVLECVHGAAATHHAAH